MNLYSWDIPANLETDFCLTIFAVVNNVFISQAPISNQLNTWRAVSDRKKKVWYFSSSLHTQNWNTCERRFDIKPDINKDVNLLWILIRVKLSRKKKKIEIANLRIRLSAFWFGFLGRSHLQQMIMQIENKDQKLSCWSV